MSAGRLTLIVAAACLGAACGGRAISPRDGGSPDAAAGDVSARENPSFKVTSTLTLMPADPDKWATFSKTQVFTVFVDAKGLRLVAGARGEGTAVGLKAAGAGAFSTTEPFYIPSAGSGISGCDRAGVDYQELTFSVKGGRLTGTARATATYFQGVGGWISPGTAKLEGIPDVEAPTVTPLADTIDPMGYASFFASEPLGESAASLIGAEGDVFVLGAKVKEGPPPFTLAFVRSPLMINWGTTYQITTEALTDLAGNMGVQSARPSVATLPAPPLVAEDGFESIATSTLGGAAVLDGTTFAPLAGAKSLVIASWSGGPLGTAGRSVSLRLLIESGDTVLRFSSRIIATSPFTGDDSLGEIRTGVPGRDVEVTRLSGPKDLVETQHPTMGTIHVGPPVTISAPLPMGARGEASLQIAVAGWVACGPQSAQVAMVIDDLRLE